MKTDSVFEIFFLGSSSGEHWAFLPACANLILWHFLFICYLSQLQRYSVILKTHQLFETVCNYLALTAYQMIIVLITLMTKTHFFQMHCVTLNTSHLLKLQQKFNFLTTDHTQLWINQKQEESFFCHLKTGVIQVPF